MFHIFKCRKILFFTQNTKISIREMKYLNVAEKNEAAKTIASLLSSGKAIRREGYSVYNKVYDFNSIVNGKQCQMVMTSVSGHLLETEFLPAYRNWRNINPVTLFDAPIRKSCKKEFMPIVRTLEREIRKCQGLIIWTDCDREGENIGMEIIDVCRAINSKLDIHRAMFSEITTTSVIRALQNLKTIDKRASDAVNVRTELDLRSGAAITRFQTMRFQRLFPQNVADKLISYGSCQIPTLGFVAERYKEIESFVSEPFWKIRVLHTVGDLTVEFIWERQRLFNKMECENYYILCVADPLATVTNVTIKPKNKWRPLPMDTVALEKLASRKLKLSAKETMTIAEKLYTKGCISYPRTETNQFSKEINLRNLVEQQLGHPVWGNFAQKIIEWEPNPRNGNKSDKAHPPIHPTKLITSLDGNEARIYELICRHFLACVSKDAVGMETKVNINIAGEKFGATGLCIHERNYLEVYIYDIWNAKEIHKYMQGQNFEPTDINMPEGVTTPPALLTEADLIALMEKHGIGTDATHAEHIHTIKERGYIGVIDKGFLVPGIIGMGLYEGYNEIKLALAKPLLRSEFEEDLKKICNGEKDPKIVLNEQIVKYKEAYKQIMDNISKMDDIIASRFAETPAYRSNETVISINETSIEHAQELFECPKCKKAVLSLKKKKNQERYFIGCLNFPDCKNVVSWPDECKQPQALEEFCSTCNNRIKLIKFKFQNHIHKTKFNAPRGWYKTCLHCDTLFRNTFDINLENIKYLGGIVDEVNTLNRRPVISSTSPAVFHNNNFIRNRMGNKTTQKKISSFNDKTENSRNLGTFFSLGRSDIKVEQVDTIVSQQLNAAVLDDFFSSNDSFENEVLLASSCSISPNDDTNISSLLNNPNNRTSELYLDSWEDAFMKDNGFDIQKMENKKRYSVEFPNILHANHKNIISNKESAQNERMLNDLSSSWGSISNPARSNNVNCIGCGDKAKKSFVTKEGPYQGRSYYKCSKNRPCKFFEWAEEDISTKNTRTASERVVDSTININCKCGKESKCFKVHKNGPNKGRDFLACANREKSCGYFQWKDDQNIEEPTSSMFNKNLWTDKNHLSETNMSGMKITCVPQKRKCGLCRQEGHTRTKCSKKDKSNI